MCYLKSDESCLYIFIFLLSTSLLAKYCVLSDQINPNNEYEENDNNSEDSINLIDSIGDSLLELNHKKTTKDNDNILLIWAKMASNLSDKLWDKLLPIFVKSNNGDTNITHECAGSLFKIILSARKQETWAIKFIDSIGKPSSGVLEGTVASFGNMNECTDIVVEDDGYDEGFHGKYCLLYLRTRLPPKPTIIRHNDLIFNIRGTEAEGTVFEYISNISAGVYSINAFRVGICLPSNCQNWEIKPLLNKIFERYHIIPDLSSKCLSKYDKIELSIHQIVSIAIISSMTLLILFASLFHWMFGSNSRNILMRLLHSWSLSRNFSQLFDFPKRDQNMLALNGIRVLTMYWIVMNHTYTFGGFYKIQWTFNNLYSLREVPRSFLFQLIFNGWPIVETFFFISGLLFIYTTLPLMERTNGKHNIFVLILHRFVRVIPSICGILAINFLWPLFTTGPILIDDSTDVYITKSCQNNWWKNLLLINNYSDPDNICLLTSWYVSADFQLFLGAIIILFAFYWNKTIGLVLNGTVLILSIICSALTTYYKQLYPTLLNVHTINIDYVEKHLKYGYFPFYHHLGPYCLGIFIGYLLLSKQDHFKLSQAKNLIAWICSPLICLSVIMSTYPWNNGVEPTQVTSILYSSLSRNVWCIGLSWIIYSCCIGSGGIVDTILSHPMFVPLSRLTFGTYLAQSVVIYIIYFTRKSVTDWTHFDFLCNGIITIILSNVISLVLYLLFESPFANLEKLILKSNEHKTPTNNYLNKSKTTLRLEINNNDNNHMSHILHITKM